MADNLEKRVEDLEAAVRELTSELARMRGVRREAPPTASASASRPAPPEQHRSNWLPANVDFESLIGRYGTLILATIAALAAVGLFLGWAIDRGYLGPPQRIALGLITAAGLAVGGIRLRKTERSFGASLLGLSLAITLVCAWGAGPALSIVPAWVAFLLASISSIVLASFAHAEDDEPLWCVGFSGAAIAPFVTANGRSNLFLLAGYGLLILATSGYAMNARRWLVASRLFLLASLGYTSALAVGYERLYGPLLAMAFPLGVGVSAVIPWTHGWGRRERLRAMGVLSALAALRSGIGMNMPLDRATVAALIAAAGVLWLVIVDRTHAVAESPELASRRLHEGDWLDAAVVPLGYIAGAIAALDASAQISGLVMIAASVVLLFAVMRFPQGSLRDAAVFASVLCAVIAALLLNRGKPLQLTAVVAGLATLCFVGNVLWRSVSWTTMGLIGLAWVVIASLGHLSTRTPYTYTPFATGASGVAAITLVALLASWRLARSEPQIERVLKGGALGWAFLWVHQEIALAFSKTVAILLRVSYYAATSVAAVWIGRARRTPVLRHIGLALAVLAAGTALYGARDLDAIGARIGADLVAAVFLLAIAYWYRRPGSITVPPSPASLSDT